MAQLKDFVAHGGGGYVGSSNRTPEIDKALEKALRGTGLKDGGIALWLTSTSGRHMMDDTKNIGAKIKEAAKSAFKDVAVWAHPDHEGSMASSKELHEKFNKHFGSEDEPKDEEE